MLDPNLLDGGRNQSQFASNVAAQFSTGATVAFKVLRIESFDATNNVANVAVQVAETLGGQTDTQTLHFVVKKINNSWLLSGDQRIASISLGAEARTNQGAFTGNSGPDVNVDVEPPVGALTGVTVTGGPFNNTALTKGSVIVDPAGNEDHFFANSPTTNLLPAGTPFTLTLSQSGGGTVSYTVKSNAFTTELISITNLSGSNFATVAHPGTPLTVQWTLPKTFPIARVRLTAEGFTSADQTSGFNCLVDTIGNGAPVLSTTATSGQITVPATCAGQPVVTGNVDVQVIGTNGEKEVVIYQFTP
jgi:hypothetical protein